MNLVTVQLLVDEGNEDRVIEGINDLLANAACVEDNEDASDKWLVDWKVGEIRDVTDELDDSVANEMYLEGEAFKDWVIYSRSEALCSEDHAGYWSNEYGWTVKDIATRFAPVKMDMPISKECDAVMLLADEFHANSLSSGWKRKRRVKEEACI